jgi:hypothetical protein
MCAQMQKSPKVQPAGVLSPVHYGTLLEIQASLAVTWAFSVMLYKT